MLFKESICLLCCIVNNERDFLERSKGAINIKIQAYVLIF